MVGCVLDETAEQEGEEGEAAAVALRNLLVRPGYRRHLHEHCGATQEILLGHADAAKRHAATARLRAVAAPLGIALRFRAGTVAGAGAHRVVALVDARVALASPKTKRALSDMNARAARGEEPPPPREPERGCWCR